MIKYFFLSLIAYYVFSNYIQPLLHKHGPPPNNTPSHEKKNNHEDEYVDYEEVD